jgi:hypothetical protein
MINEAFSEKVRDTRHIAISVDFVVVGAGLAGICAAIQAARQGIKVVLLQDRPVVGGNASSEVRLWTLGATSHMGNNNRWAREGGIIDEILVENLFRNREGNPLILDTILLEKILLEPNITLLLNTSVYSCKKSASDKISSIRAYCSQNSTSYEVTAPLFCDASGDGILGYCSGASFRMGAETKQEFGELFAPDRSYGELLGHTLYFYSKDTGKPVRYVAPSFALKDPTLIPRFRNIQSSHQGCNFWWFEYGGRRDTVHDTEEIKWELWKVVYGVWDYIKNSGKFPEAENLTLEWVGMIPGKRESRRFEGHYMLKQQDVVEQKSFDDAVAFGGWSLDLHPSDGVYSDRPPCNQWHSKGIYGIPYRCYISRNIANLFLAGRIISASHVAFGSTRVMATCAHGGQAVGMAAAKCVEKNLLPADLLEPEAMRSLQESLNLRGQSIPGTVIQGKENLLGSANIEVSSELIINEMKANGEWLSLHCPAGQMLPVRNHTSIRLQVELKSVNETKVLVQLRKSENSENHTPEILLEEKFLEVAEGLQTVDIQFEKTIDEDQYVYVCFFADKTVSIALSEERYTGILSVFRKEHKAVSNSGRQEPPPNIGVDSFDFWIPERRPAGKNLAMKVDPMIAVFNAENLKKGKIRPTNVPNAWVADLNDEKATLRIEWHEIQSISAITLYFDPDYDHPMESVQMGHPESKSPFCVSNYRVCDDKGDLIFQKAGNYQAINEIVFDHTCNTSALIFEFEKPSPIVPVSLFYVYIC